MQIKPKTNGEAQSGGSFITISRATLPSKSVMRPVVRTNVPNKPARNIFHQRAEANDVSPNA